MKYVDKVLQVKVGKANNVTASAAFKSKSKREGMIIKDHAQMPAPCKYSKSSEYMYKYSSALNPCKTSCRSNS